MTTLFEETDSTNPPSPSLELLDTSGIKNELDDAQARKLPTNTSTTSGTQHGNVTVSRNNGNNNGQHNIGDTFASFVNESNQLPGDVRVVHVQAVAEDNNHQNVTVPPNVSSAATLYTVGGGAGQISQVITPSDGTNLNTVTVDSQDASRYAAYYPVQSNDSNQGASQFYVMMSPQDVIPVTGNNAPRIIAPRSQSLTQLGDGTFTVETSDEGVPVQFRKVETTRTLRDERRRATHNEVERRRRDKINTWIMKIAAVIPDCQMDQSKQGTSKGGVLSKALDHIIKLRGENDRMHETIKEQERILVENQVLRQQVEKLRQENAILQANLQLRQAEHIHVEQQKTMEAE